MKAEPAESRSRPSWSRGWRGDSAGLAYRSQGQLERKAAAALFFLFAICDFLASRRSGRTVSSLHHPRCGWDFKLVRLRNLESGSSSRQALEYYRRHSFCTTGSYSLRRPASPALPRLFLEAGTFLKIPTHSSVLCATCDGPTNLLSAELPDLLKSWTTLQLLSLRWLRAPEWF